MGTRKMGRFGITDCYLEEEAYYGAHFWRLDRPSQSARRAFVGIDGAA